MLRFEQVYHLENRTFTVSKNLGDIPVRAIKFSSYESENMINGTLRGEGISSGRFLGRFVASDQIDVFFQWIDNLSLLVVSGRLRGFICGNPSEKLQMFLNWYYMRGKKGFGAMSCAELKEYAE
jgi:hypothetical protein